MIVRVRVVLKRTIVGDSDSQDNDTTRSTVTPGFKPLTGSLLCSKSATKKGPFLILSRYTGSIEIEIFTFCIRLIHCIPWLIV